MRLLMSNTPGLGAGRVVTTTPAIITLPALSGGNSYVDVRATVRLIENYTGPLYKLYCSTASPTTLTINQDVNGIGDESGVLAWAGSGDVFFDGHYSQMTGNYCPALSNAKKMLWRGRKEGNIPCAIGGWNATTSVLDQGYPGEAISVNRQNVAIYTIMRPEPVSQAAMYASLETSAPALSFAITARGSSGTHCVRAEGGNTRVSTLLPPVNRATIIGQISSPSALKIRVGTRRQSFAATTSGAAVLSYMGRNTTNTEAFAVANYIGHIVTASCPTDDEDDAIAAAVLSILGADTNRSNILHAIPHSLAANLNAGVFNNSMWKQIMPLLDGPLEIVVTAVNGRSMATQLASEMTDITNTYDATATNYIYYMGGAVNDVNALASGFANGNTTIINSSAQAIFDTYMDMKDALKAQGANVHVIIHKMWLPLSNFWTGTTQDRADKGAVLTAFNALLDANAVTEGYAVSDETSVNSLSDTVHTGETGEGQRAPALAPHINAII